MANTIPVTYKPTIHNGAYTLANVTDRTHRSLQIETQGADSSFMPGKRIISLLTGPDNTYDWTSFGFVSDKAITVWQKKRGEDGKQSDFERIASLLWRIAQEPVGDDGKQRVVLSTRGAAEGSDGFREVEFELLCERRCLRCNRRLTTPASIEQGFGPVCKNSDVDEVAKAVQAYFGDNDARAVHAAPPEGPSAIAVNRKGLYAQDVLLFIDGFICAKGWGFYANPKEIDRRYLLCKRCGLPLNAKRAACQHCGKTVEEKSISAVNA